ncbi:MAG: hypothetical protein GY820_39185 [Gammaproteobacteria bacterium]|nr:hypothetical protein [Gammaproteobacteria bacterium]
MRSKWRAIARPIISKVIKEVGLEDEKKLKKALLDAYPFYERENHPYKIWLDEIKVQTGKKKPGRIKPVNEKQWKMW